MKKWVRKNYTIESTFLLCKIDYYVYPISYHGKIYTVRLERSLDALYGSIYSYKEDAKHHRGKKLYFTDIPALSEIIVSSLMRRLKCHYILMKKIFLLISHS